MSTVYVQVHLPFSNILCLDMAIREAGGTWNAPEYIQELRQAKIDVSKAQGTQDIISANNAYSRLLQSINSETLPKSIQVNLRGQHMNFVRKKGQYSMKASTRREAGLNSLISSISSLYEKNMKLIQNEIETTLQTISEQKDVLSAEHVESLRSAVETQQNAIREANQERVVEVTKEIEEKLVARGFEIRKRIVGKKIVYQAVRR